MASVAERAYLAGIIDGEGSISMTRVTGQRRGNKDGSFEYYRITVSVSSCDLVLIDWLHQRWGGARMVDMDRGPTRRLQHRWQIVGNNVRQALRESLPYYVIKGERAARALEVLAIQAGPRLGYRKSYSQQQRDQLTALREWFDAEKQGRSAAVRGQKGGHQ